MQLNRNHKDEKKDHKHMHDTLVIRFTPQYFTPAAPDSQEQLFVEWLSLTELPAQGPPQISPLAEIVNQRGSTPPRRTIVLLPGEHVLLSSVTIPSRNNRYIRQALPFAVEEQLAQDLDQVHIAMGPRNPDGSITVAIVDQRVMNQCLHDLSIAGFEVDLLLPDSLAILQPSGKSSNWNLWIEDSQRALLCTDSHQAIATAPTTIPLYLQSILQKQQHQDSPVPLDIFFPFCSEDQLDYATLEMELASEERLQTNKLYYQEHILVELTNNLLQQSHLWPHSLNLLQGAYAKRKGSVQQLLPWKTIAAAIFIWLVAEVGITLAQTLHLERQAADTKAKAESIYREIFTGDQRIVNIRAQMQSHINQARQQGHSHESFLELLAGMGSVLQEVDRSDQVMLRHISYHQQRSDLLVELHLQSFDQLEQYREALESNNFEAEVQSAVVDGDIVRSRIILRKKA
ncbi:general secretion pathway protein L [Desulfurispira natronophila]|uniref:General secretion pathway protein L n=2 Tax=Desulfurispira natronophila TaxID=682562 RepID=A0A7W7Y5T5_9BACT|nr:general secretion pathway protein L [Desulfurispira natronophila]